MLTDQRRDQVNKGLYSLRLFLCLNSFPRFSAEEGADVPGQAASENTELASSFDITESNRQ